ncbi:unnamed protein product, partial [Ceratitis capitata]
EAQHVETVNPNLQMTILGKAFHYPTITSSNSVRDVGERVELNIASQQVAKTVSQWGESRPPTARPCDRPQYLRDEIDTER